MAFLYGRAGRLTAKNGGFRPGQWIHDSENMLPGYTTHTMGVGAVVINERREILALQEATGPASKAFGGASSRGSLSH